MDQKIALTNQVFKVVGLLEKTGNQLFSEFGLTVKTYAILSAIKEGCNKSTDLANSIVGSKSSVTQKTKVLEAQGFIKRNVNQKDKRVWYFSLTRKGRKILQDILPAYRKAVKCLYQSLSNKEVGQTLKTLKVTEQHLQLIIDKKYLIKFKK